MFDIAIIEVCILKHKKYAQFQSENKFLLAKRADNILLQSISLDG